MKSNFEIKSAIVKAGESKVYKNWKALVPALAEDEFIGALKWLCDDPRDDQGRLTREIGLTKAGVVYLDRIYELGHCIIYRRDNNKLWEGDCFRVDCDNYWFADAEGKILANYKISLSCMDRV